MTKSTTDQFSERIEEETNKLIEECFSYKVDEGDVLYHFTSEVGAKMIIASNSYWASFIRSTSDTLEFALPLSICRDWLCFEDNLYSFKSQKVFPDALFAHFNEQAINPIARYYFVSLTPDAKSEHHLKCYGRQAIEFKFGTGPAELKDFMMILKCIYPEDFNKEIHSLLNKWRDVFYRVVAELKIEASDLPNEAWFYMFMRFCHMISLCLKQKSFQDEKEVRIVVVPNQKFIDQSDKFHGKRNVTMPWDKSLLVREYLPLKLNEMGISISLI